MYSRILVPLDGSPAAEQVLPLTKAIAEQFHSSVILFRAIAPLHDAPSKGRPRVDADKQIELSRWAALEYLQAIGRDFAACDIPAECQTEVGSPAWTILDFAQIEHVDLIALTTHGRTGGHRSEYGRVADRVVHAARVPSLVVRASDVPSAAAPITRILVPLDGSVLAERALEPARQLAAAFHAELLLLRVWQDPVYSEVPEAVLDEMERQARRAAEGYMKAAVLKAKDWNVSVNAESHLGPVAERIVETAKERSAGLIVMSSHGRSGLGRWVMGSVTDRVLAASPVPVLLIRAVQPSK